MEWNDLSMQERAEVMKLALENGIYDLNTIKEGYNEFAKGGYVREKNDNPIAFDEEGNLIDQVTGEQGTMRVPTVTVTGRDLRKPYFSSFDGSVRPWAEYFGALSKGLQPLSISQQVGAVADAVQGKRNYLESLFNGNSGFFTDKYAEEHPVISTLGNMAGDVAIPLSPTIVKGAKAPRYRLETSSTQNTVSKTPNITANNAATATDAQWDAAYIKALDSGNKNEAQRLRDLHFNVKAPNTKITTSDGKPAHIYHGTDADWVQYDPTKFGTATDEGYYGIGLYGTEYKPLAKGYGENIMDLYVNSKRPFTAGTQNIEGIPYNMNEAIDRSSAIYYFNRDRSGVKFSPTSDKTDVKALFKELDNADAAVYGTPNQRFNEVVIPTGEQIKLADVVTYDDAGNVIPLSKRDNFKLNDVRYMLPWGLSGLGVLYGNKEK